MAPWKQNKEIIQPNLHDPTHLLLLSFLKPGVVLADIDGLVQDCSNSSALAMELLQSCTEPSI